MREMAITFRRAHSRQPLGLAMTRCSTGMYRIDSISPGSALADSLRVGDFISSVNGVPTSSDKHLVSSVLQMEMQLSLIIHRLFFKGIRTEILYL